MSITDQSRLSNGGRTVIETGPVPEHTMKWPLEQVCIHKKMTTASSFRRHRKRYDLFNLQCHRLLPPASRHLHLLLCFSINTPHCRPYTQRTILQTNTILLVLAFRIQAFPANPNIRMTVETVPAQHHQHNGERHDTMVMQRPPSSHDVISAAPVSSEHHNYTSQAGVPIGDLSRAANDSSSGDHMLRTLQGRVSHSDGMLPSAYTSNLQQTDHTHANDQALYWSHTAYQSSSGDTHNKS